MTALFISDLHLSPLEPGTAQTFLDFLAGPARNATSLTILGDLFDYWIGDDDLADPFNLRIALALRALADHGVNVEFMAGNRDFLIGAGFAETAGLSLLPDPSLRNLGGVPTLLLHGDTLCTDDLAYLRFRAKVRDAAWPAAFLARPLDVRRREVEDLRAQSMAAQREKADAILDVNADAVAAAFRSHGATALIHGHTHRQACHDLNVDGKSCQRWVLGDWHPGQGTALACTANGWHWLSFT